MKVKNVEHLNQKTIREALEAQGYEMIKSHDSNWHQGYLYRKTIDLNYEYINVVIWIYSSEIPSTITRYIRAKNAEVEWFHNAEPWFKKAENVHPYNTQGRLAFRYSGLEDIVPSEANYMKSYDRNYKRDKTFERKLNIKDCLACAGIAPSLKSFSFQFNH